MRIHQDFRNAVSVKIIRCGVIVADPRFAEGFFTAYQGVAKYKGQIIQVLIPLDPEVPRDIQANQRVTAILSDMKPVNEKYIASKLL